MNEVIKEITDKLTEFDIATLILTPMYLNDKIALIDGRKGFKETAITISELADNLFVENERLEAARNELNRIESLDDIEQDKAKESLYENYKSVLQKFPEDYQTELKSNMLEGFIKVAKASGAGFLGMGEKIDISERNLIMHLIERFDINVGGKSLDELLSE